MKYPVALLTLALAACHDGPRSEERAFVDPIHGNSYPARVTELEGWSTIQFSAAPEAYLMLAQAAGPVVTVMDREAGRWVFVEQGSEGSGTINLQMSRDHKLVRITFVIDGMFHVIEPSATGWAMASHPLPTGRPNRRRARGLPDAGAHHLRQRRHVPRHRTLGHGLGDGQPPPARGPHPMNDFPWICPACRTQVPGGIAACGVCGCPESAGADEIDRYMRAYSAQANAGVRSDPRCPKCSGEMSVRGELRGSGGGISAAFEFSNVRFESVSCAVCGYTEFYRSEVSALGQLGDLLAG